MICEYPATSLSKIRFFLRKVALRPCFLSTWPPSFQKQGFSLEKMSIRRWFLSTRSVACQKWGFSLEKLPFGHVFRGAGDHPLKNKAFSEINTHSAMICEHPASSLLKMMCFLPKLTPQRPTPNPRTPWSLSQNLKSCSRTVEKEEFSSRRYSRSKNVLFVMAKCSRRNRVNLF